METTSKTPARPAAGVDAERQGTYLELLEQRERAAMKALAEAAVRLSRVRGPNMYVLRTAVANYEAARLAVVADKLGFEAYGSCDECNGSGSIVDDAAQEQLACEFCEGSGVTER